MDIGPEVVGGGELQGYAWRSGGSRSGRTTIYRWEDKFCVYEQWCKAFLRAGRHGLVLLLAT